MAKQPVSRNDVYSVALLLINLYLYSIILPTLKFVIFRYVPVPSINSVLISGLYGILLFLLVFNMFQFKNIYHSSDDQQSKLISKLFNMTTALIILNILGEILVSRLN